MVLIVERDASGHLDWGHAREAVGDGVEDAGAWLASFARYQALYGVKRVPCVFVKDVDGFTASVA